MFLRKYMSVVACVAMLLGLCAGPANATSSSSNAATTHETRLWTQVPSGANGYAKVTHTYTATGGGYYTGSMTYWLTHYQAPSDRQVIIMFRVDGTFGGYDLTSSSKSASRTYSHQKVVSARVCLHKAGVAVGLNSGVSYCSPWWG
jgi:hypothetical protein